MERIKKQQEETKECTFRPQINKSSSVDDLGPKKYSKKVARHDVLYEQGKVKTNQRRQLPEKSGTENIELEQCTFKPKIKRRFFFCFCICICYGGFSLLTY